MASPRPAKISKHTLKEPTKPEFPLLDPGLLSQWVDAVADYARALNNMGWFAAPADEREGRLFLEEIPHATPELKQAQAVLNSLLVKPSDEKVSPLIEAFESCILLSFPVWKPIIKHLKKQKLDELSETPPVIKNKIYFFLGRHIADNFCLPIQLSQKWSLFLIELSQKIHDHLSSELPEKEAKRLIDQQAAALGTVILGAAAYCLLKTWNDLYIPKAEEGTSEGRISRKKQQVLNTLLQPLSATFNDSPTFLLKLSEEYKSKKVSIPLLALRMEITTEIDDRLIKYVHKSEVLSDIRQLKLQLQTELKEKLKEKFKDKGEDKTSSDNDEDKPSSPASLSPPKPSTRARAASMPAPASGVNPSDLLESSIFRQRRTSTPEKDKKDESKPEINPVI